MPRRPRHITFVTGTRAELGLMLRTLAAIREHPRLSLSVVATGMHVDGSGGPRLSALRAAGVRADAVVAWRRSPDPTARAETTARADPTALAETTARAAAGLARAYRKLGTEGLLVVGDRVEAAAAAFAAHIARIPIAHVHGGDRAEGQVDDSLRHMISKLASLHLAACPDSARRLLRLGEARGSVHIVGAPGVEGLGDDAASREEVEGAFPEAGRSVLVLRHPVSPDVARERRGAAAMVRALLRAGAEHLILLLPNNDPGSDGIREAWRRLRDKCTVRGDLPRPLFLGLLRDARLLAGNSSAGIIEAGSFGTPVLDIGPRQRGRVRGRNVASLPDDPARIEAAARRLLTLGRRPRPDNPYARPGTAARIAQLLADKLPAPPAPPKLILY